MGQTVTRLLEGTTLGPLDVLVFGGSLSISVLIGLYFANKNSTFRDYTTGGGNQSLWPVAASMAAVYASALTTIGNPSELYLHGPSFTVSLVATVLSWPLSAFVFLPVFRRLNAISVFQYIEERYSSGLRRFISLLFITMMSLYVSMALYIPSLSLSAILGVTRAISIGLVGAVCLVYCTFGGLQAVVWTNLFHSTLMCLIMASILVAGTLELGGPKRVWSLASEGGRLSLDGYLNVDLTTRHTLYNMLLGYLPIRAFLHGVSQMQVQSALSLATLRKGQMALLIAAIIYLLINTAASSIGLLLYAKYKDCDPFANGQIQRRDAILMHYLSEHLSFIPALQGLFIASVFGSTLTAMASYQSSMSAMVVEDFVRPALKQWCNLSLDEQRGATLGKLTALLFGLLCIGLTFLADRIDGLLQVTTSLFCTFGAPIFTSFLLGVLTRFINTKGMFAGQLVSLAFGIYAQAYQIFVAPPLEPTLHISAAICPLRQPDLPLLSGSTVRASIPFPVDDTAGSVNVGPTMEETIFEQEPPEFNLVQMSYFWLPFFLMLLCTLVASLVSLLTGGLEQKIADKYLADFKHNDYDGGDVGHNHDDHMDAKARQLAPKTINTDCLSKTQTA